MVRTMFLFLVLSLATLDSSPILLPASHVAVDATGDLVINQTLSAGFKVSGKITGELDADSES